MSTITLTIAPHTDQASLEKIFNEVTFTTDNGAMQAQAKTGNRWALHMGWIRGRSDYMTLCGQIDALLGKINRLQVPMSKIGITKVGVGGGTPLVQGAHSAGATT